MKSLDKRDMSKKFSRDHRMYGSVCNSCACGGGVGSCNTTCKFAKEGK